jgi:crotonobetainyl-CoA:carnitine CoA-transferase CaiB-like acyl-CoA transferase
LFASPVQFDRTAPELDRAPEFGEHTDDILASIEMSEDEALRAKVSGAVI